MLELLLGLSVTPATLQIGPAIAVRFEVYLAWNRVGMETCTPTHSQGNDSSSRGT